MSETAAPDTSGPDAGSATRLAELMKDIPIAMLTTVDSEGHFTSRPMGQQEVEFDGSLWFFSDSQHLFDQIAANAHVSVTLSSSDTWISLDGDAEVVEDQAKKDELWNAGVEAWLPQGPDDPQIKLIKVNGHSAEYWDTPGSRIATAISLIKSKVTGQPFEGGENATVQL